MSEGREGDGVLCHVNRCGHFKARRERGRGGGGRDVGDSKRVRCCCSVASRLTPFPQKKML